MIHTKRTVTIGNLESIIDKPIVLYRGDREVEVEFTLIGSDFTFSNRGEVIESMNATHGQLVINTPTGEHMFSEIAECDEGGVIFIITKEMIDELIEIGFYSFQIRLFDESQVSRVTIPPVTQGIEIRNPIAAEDETNVVDVGLVDYSRIGRDQLNEEMPTFDWAGNYIKTNWVEHDIITENKMNKIEDGIWTINNKISESDNVFLKKAEDMERQRQNDVNKLNSKDTQLTNDIQNVNRNLTNSINTLRVDMEVGDIAWKNEMTEYVDGELAEVDLEIEANRNRIQGWVNACEYGMSPDNEDNSDILQQLVDNASTIIIPKGTYKFKNGITITNAIEIDGNNCTFIFEGVGSFITLMSNNLIFNRLNIQSSKGRDSETLQICFDAEDMDKVNRQIRFNYVNVNGFSDSAFVLNSQWHITLKHCTIGKCGAFNVDNPTGAIVIRGEQMSSAWNGSGNIIEDCYISGCNYGLYGGGAWNVQLNNVIFEYNNYPIRKGVGRYIGTNRCWFEGNLHGCYGGGIDSVGDRGFSAEADTINFIYERYDKPGSEGVYGGDNTPYFQMTDGKITKFTLHEDSGIRTAFDKNGTQHLTISNGTVIAGEGGGTVNAGKPAYENSLLRLAGYGGYWATTIEKANTPLCALDLNYTSNNSSNGRGFGGFDFKTAQVNGQAVARELLSVFGVDSAGNITPMQLNGTSNIGSATARYNNIYANAIILTSPNGTAYKITVDDDGTLKTAKA